MDVLNSSQSPTTGVISLQSEENIMHIMEAEQYTPSQVSHALCTMLDDERSFHFQRIIVAPRVKALAPAWSASGTSDSTSPLTEQEKLLQLLDIFARGDLSSYLKRKTDFSILMDDFPDRLQKLKTICVRELQTTLGNPEILDFSAFIDLVDHPLCIGALPEHTMLLKMVELMAFDTTESPVFQELSSSGILTKTHERKIRCLSLASFAAENKTLSYASLQERLGISTEDKLEDFLIDAMATGFVEATIDQSNKKLLVAQNLPRYVRRKNVGLLMEKLATWTDISENIIARIDSKIEAIKRKEMEASQREVAVKERVKKQLATKVSTLANQK